MLNVYEEAGLSPGIHTKKHADKQFKRRLKVGERSRLPSTKRRRLQLKQERNVTQCALQALEGDTYQSEIGLADEVDIEQIPDPVPRGIFKPVTLSSGAPSFVAFDLETTGLSKFSRTIFALMMIKSFGGHVTAFFIGHLEAMKCH